MDHLHSRLRGVASKLGIEESFNQQYSSEAILSMQLLKEDISVVMRERAQKGYSMNVQCVTKKMAVEDNKLVIIKKQQNAFVYAIPLILVCLHFIKYITMSFHCLFLFRV